MKKNVEPNIEWVCIDQWYCNDCQTYIDDNVELMEMHECKINKINESEVIK